ncbi:MAG TPA: hypothetical protein VG963_11775 [Polyangiaceae bacterium]|nr:hypothetical protein [Polyangiaceae bacterium]
MAPLRRALWFASWLVAVAACEGPTSDWPKGASDEGDDDKSPGTSQSAGKDAGTASEGKLDAGSVLLDAANPSVDTCQPSAADAPDGGVPDAGDPADDETADAAGCERDH